MSLTWADIVTDALRELGVLNAADPASGEDAVLGLLRANKILDNWNATQQAVYAQIFTPYTTTPALSPHTIGPTGTFVVATRPQAIESAAIVLNGVTIPITPDRDRDWYSALPLPDLAGSIITDLYYEPSWPNGSLYFWPVPSAALSIVLQTRVLLAEVDLADTFTLPPGYQDALTLTLAEDLAAPFRVAVSPITQQHAREARARIFGNNVRPVRIRTQDAGMPSGGSKRGTFNYLTGV